MKINKDQMFVSMEGPGTLIRNQTDMGGMTAGYVQLPKGTYFTPIFKGVPTDSCHCSHWVMYSKEVSVLFMMMGLKTLPGPVMYSISIPFKQRRQTRMSCHFP